MTRQAIQLGWLPRMTITQTSEEGYGQIYVGTVNWLLMIVTLALTIGFGKSDNLAAAYGIAVSATMLMTSVLLFIAMREVWKWPVGAAAAVAACFILIDGSFFFANMAKVMQGGWVPLLLASIVYGVMWIWHRGAAEVQKRVEAGVTPISELIAELEFRQDRAGAGVRGVLHPRQGPDSARDGLARAPEPVAASTRARPDDDGAFGSARRSGRSVGAETRGRPFVAGGGQGRLH